MGSDSETAETLEATRRDLMGSVGSGVLSGLFSGIFSAGASPASETYVVPLTEYSEGEVEFYLLEHKPDEGVWMATGQDGSTDLQPTPDEAIKEVLVTRTEDLRVYEGTVEPFAAETSGSGHSPVGDDAIVEYLRNSGLPDFKSNDPFELQIDVDVIVEDLLSHADSELAGRLMRETNTSSPAELRKTLMERRQNFEDVRNAVWDQGDALKYDTFETLESKLDFFGDDPYPVESLGYGSSRDYSMELRDTSPSTVLADHVVVDWPKLRRHQGKNVRRELSESRDFPESEVGVLIDNEKIDPDFSHLDGWNVEASGKLLPQHG